MVFIFQWWFISGLVVSGPHLRSGPTQTGGFFMAEARRGRANAEPALGGETPKGFA